MSKFLLFLLIFPISLKSQDILFTKSNIIQVLVAYRNKLLTEDINATNEVKMLEKKWGDLGQDNQEFRRLALNISPFQNRNHTRLKTKHRTFRQ